MNSQKLYRVKPNTFFATARNQPLIWLVFLVIIRGLLYLSIFPPFLAPDEPAHYEAIRIIGQVNHWPTYQVYQTTPMHPEMSSVFEQFRIWLLVGLNAPVDGLGAAGPLFIDYYAAQVAGSQVQAGSYLMLYHAGLAPFLSVLKTYDLTTQVYLLRLISVVIASASVVVVWITVRTLFPKQRLYALGVTTFIVFWPMHTHVTASINTDTLAELIGSLYFLVLVFVYRDGVSGLRVALIAALLGLALLTKPTLYFLFPTSAAALLIYWGDRYSWQRHWVRLLLAGIIVVTATAAIVLHVNSLGGRSMTSLLAGSFRSPEWIAYVSPTAFSEYVSATNFAVVSFWGLFGWSNIHIPWAWVKLLAGVNLLFIIGALTFAMRSLVLTKPSSSLSRFQKETLTLFLIAIILAFVGVATPIIVAPSPSWGIHSRYYFPVIIPLSLYIFLGVRQLTPTTLRRFLWPGWLLAWVLYDALVFLVILLPFLYS